MTETLISTVNNMFLQYIDNYESSPNSNPLDSYIRVPKGVLPSYYWNVAKTELLLGEDTDNFNFILPVNMPVNCYTTYKTTGKLLNNLMRSPIINCFRLEKNKAKYYGGRGILLNEDKELLFLAGWRHEMNISNIIELKEPVLYINEKIFLHSKDIINAFIIKKLIPGLHWLTFYAPYIDLPSFVGALPLTIIITNLNNFSLKLQGTHAGFEAELLAHEIIAQAMYKNLVTFENEEEEDLNNYGESE